MGQMTDMMVDLETTHTIPDVGGIIQVAAVKWNADTGEIGDTFDRCPVPLPLRHWSDSTKEFWLDKHRAIYQQIVQRQEPYPAVYRDFINFASASDLKDGYRFWAKPITFDWSFLNSNLEQLGLWMPFSFRHGRDVNTYIAALHGSAEHVEMDIPFHGDPHNALHDCAHQIDMVLAAKAKFVTTEVL